MSQNQESIQEYLERSRETIRKSNALLEQVKAKLAESQEFYQRLGITPEEVDEALNDPTLPPELRQRIDETLADWQHEIEAIRGDVHVDHDAELEHRQNRLAAMKNNFRI